jgi:hypothetical protein
MIEIRSFDPGRDAEAVAAALVDSSIHHAGLEPERYGILDPLAVAEDYRAGRQHPTGVPPGERTTLVGELDGLVAGVIDVRIAYPGGSHRRLRYG